MNFISTPINDVYIIEPSIYQDQRGYFFESFNEKVFQQKTSLDISFIQDNESKTKKNVLRGLHFQTFPYVQSKLVRVISGKILDVAVDLRKNSSTFKKYFSIELSSKNKKQLFIPRGFAHGFISLKDDTIVNYKVDNFYSQEHDSGIIYNDIDLNIDWGQKDNIFLSEKDANLKTLQETNIDCFKLWKDKLWKIF